MGNTCINHSNGKGSVMESEVGQSLKCGASVRWLNMNLKEIFMESGCFIWWNRRENSASICALDRGLGILLFIKRKWEV